ncbi:MAG: metallophosphoesterase family protein [Bacteroidota bacterium]
MKKILLLSDTHNHIDENILNYCRKSDEVWHAGDIGNEDVTNKIKEVTKLRAVFGNIDGTKLRSEFPLDNIFTIENVKVWITHIGGYPNRYESRIKKEIENISPDLFISGHSHILKVQFDKKNNLLHMNPGAAGIYGLHKSRTMLRFKIDGNEIKNLEVIEIKKK